MVIQCRESWWSIRTVRFLLSGTMLILSLGGCSSLPSSGPTADDITAAQSDTAANGFRVEDITANTITTQMGELSPAQANLSGLKASGNVDAVGPGDVLQITVFEIGTSLFSGMSGGGLTNPSSSGLMPPSVAGENLPPVQVDRDGAVTLPYIGRLYVKGRTPAEIQSLIAKGLKGKSQNPQVLVSVRERVWSTITVMGEAKKPGALPLLGPHERVLDAIAESEGANQPSQDIIVRLTRGETSASVRLSSLTAGSIDNIVLLPQDRIELLYRPLSFTVFGAAGKVSQVPFQSSTVSLAEAVARVGGPVDQQADPSAIFVFRYNKTTVDGAPEPGAVPIAYRLDLSKPESYFLAQRFPMCPRDVIYIANARSNQPTKLIQVLNLFFSPAYTAKVLAQ